MASRDLYAAAMGNRYLPGDIMIEILSRLPVKSLLRFRCVCKPWAALITNPAFITLHLKQSLHNPQSHHDLLIFSHGRIYKVCIIINETFDAPLKLDIPPRISPFEIVGSCNGLICLSANEIGSKIILWNPATRQHRSLPAPDISYSSFLPFDSVSLGFGFHPHTDDYKLVRVVYFKHGSDRLSVEVELYTLSTSSWRTLEAAVPGVIYESSSRAAVKGVLYWMATGLEDLHDREFIVSFDMGNEVFGKIRLPDSCSDRVWDEIGKRLMLLKESLALIVYSTRLESNRHFDIWVINEDGVDTHWTKQLAIRPLSQVTWPVGCCGNGEIVLKSSDQELYLYFPDTQTTRHLPGCGYQLEYEAYSYTESLVNLNTAR